MLLSLSLAASCPPTTLNDDAGNAWLLLLFLLVSAVQIQFEISELRANNFVLIITIII